MEQNQHASIAKYVVSIKGYAGVFEAAPSDEMVLPISSAGSEQLCCCIFSV